MQFREAKPSDAQNWIELLKTSIGNDYPVKQVYDVEYVISLLDPANDEETYVVDSGDKLLASATILKPVEFINNPVMNLGRILFRHGSYSDESAKLLINKIREIAFKREQLVVARVPGYDIDQQILFENCGFICVGFQPYKHTIQTRKGFLFYVLKVENVLSTRTTISESLPQIGELAETVLESIGIVNPMMLRDGVAGYPLQSDLVIHTASIEDFELWKAQSLQTNPIPEISTGSNRGVGLFRLPSNSQYQALIGQRGNQIVSGIAFFFDEIDRCVRILDGFSTDDISMGAMLQQVLNIAQQQYSSAYVESDFVATSPRLLKCAEQLGFIPCAYFPAFFRVSNGVSDVVKMVKLNMSYTPEVYQFTNTASKIVKIIDQNFQDLKTGVAIINLLRALPIFKGLGDGELRKVARLFTQKLFRPGEQIFNKGDKGDEAYIVMRGQIDICLSEDSKPIASIGNGQIFGEQAFLDGSPRTAMAIATQPSILLVVRRDAFNELVQREPHLGMVIMRNIATDISNKLRKANAILLGLKH
ncbi:MAG: cyclic nucleotide-binding domain-containing protein [Verrucomicrobiia bacterium]